MTRSLNRAEPTADLDRVTQIVRRSGTSFFWAMRLLPPAQRHAMYAVYAFCREVDDIADEPAAIDEKRRRLSEWRREIDQLYAGQAGQPITRVLSRFLGRFQLRQEDFVAVIDGMEMDAAEALRIQDVDELTLYCDRVACAVGRHSVRIFGMPEPIGDRLAAAQGEALQLTNILRDLKEDARRNRLYLPADLLRDQGVEDLTDADAVLRQPGTTEVCRALATKAAARFDEANAILTRCDRRRVRPATIMMEMYRRTFRRLTDRGWGRWAEPVSVPPTEKLWVALRHGII